jgi:hypothetical protein
MLQLYTEVVMRNAGTMNFAKPVARQGRKATGFTETAGLHAFKIQGQPVQ